ncbi:MAG: outer membrane beta-barrel protein [Chitinophagaceae bacterium]
MHKLLLSFFCLITVAGASYAQTASSAAPGLITGNVLDDKKNAVAGASVELYLLPDTTKALKSTLTDKNGDFSIAGIAFGWYRLAVTNIGFQSKQVDSIHLRAERYDFNLIDLTLVAGTSNAMNEVVVYAEKPLIQSKDGNITFNAGESALSAGANASELLKNVPLVASDPDGKMVVKGKEPKILIDDKPVELNAQQLQDFLESLPGSMIERIEVMTNPPAQYANEQGGVINIITRKGKVGMGARLTLTGGTRGEAGANGNFNYRKKGLSINFNAGVGYNLVKGDGYSRRQNIYKDSVNYYNTTNSYRNRSTRPNARLSVDYDIDSRNLLNVLLQYNQNTFRNRSENEFVNLDHTEQIYKLSTREITTNGESLNPSMNLTYTHKGKKPGETLRFIAGANYSSNPNERVFFQQYLNPDYSQSGRDSTQSQLNDSKNSGYSMRVNYDKMLDNKKTSFSTGGYYSYSNNHVTLDSRFLRKPDNVYETNELLSNDFLFKQVISNIRFSVRQVIVEGMNVTAGITAENTNLHFDLKDKSEIDNQYLTWLPFVNFNKSWENVLNLSMSYRKTIRRPGIGNLNPSIDYSDPNNIRFGNPELNPTVSHNIDVVLGKTGDKYYVNLGMGYNVVQDIFSQIRTLQPNGTTQTTWQNIDDRHEYELNTWSGYTFSKKFRVNFSASYSFNEYSAYDKTVNKYRNGGSLTSSFNSNFVPSDVWVINSNFTYNRFANPQGTVRSSLAMNIGIQRKLLNKKLIVTLNAIDPFIQQEYSSYTYGANYVLQSFSATRTRNFRLTVAYNFTQLAKKNGKKQQAVRQLIPARG